MAKRSWTRSALLSCVCSVLLASHASAEALKRRIDIPAGDLTVALELLAKQSGAEFVYSMDKLKGLRTKGVEGELSTEDAVIKLLEGTPLTLKIMHDSGAFLIAESKPDETSTIETVNVFGTLENELSVGSKSGQSLRETPKSVTLVTRERIEAQNLSSLMETLNQTTGVTVQSYSNGGADSFFFSRGFRVNTLQLDGGAPAFTGGFGMFLVPDMAAYDHIEMLRGVDGMYTGAGGPGGVINLVRKQPKRDFELRVNLSAGRWENYRSEIDVTGPLTQDGRLRGRLVGAIEDKGYFVDRATTEKLVAYGVTEFDLTESTLLALGVSYESRDESAYSNSGLPRYADGSDPHLPRSTNLSSDWSHWNFDTKEIFARAEQRYGDDGVLKLNLTRIEQTSEQRAMFTRGTVNPLTQTGVMGRATGGDFSSTQFLVDVSASGTFDLFGHNHRYTVGTDYANIDGGGQRSYAMPGYTFATARALDVFNFDQSLFPEPTPVWSGLYPENGQAQNGIYATVGLQLAEPLRLTLGGRYSEFRYRQEFRAVAANGTLGTPSVTRYDDEAFIPSVALSYDFANDWSAYVSYAETFEVQANMLQGPLPGTPLDPITGAGLEFGVKGELGLVNVSAAVYRVERNGQGIQDPAYPNLENGPGGSSCCFVRQANIISQGFDAELSGTLAPGWQLFSGYTYNSNEAEDDPTAGFASGAYFLNITPKHMFKLWSTWQLPGRWSRWTVNGGVVAQTENFVTGTALAAPGSTTQVPYRFAQDSYALWNASVQYRLGDSWTIALYGENLTDETYYQVLGSTDRENVYGMPRSYVLKLGARW
jgi:outer membrane receptor for ferric coprogen and ferric-rhodotorulic acid